MFPDEISKLIKDGINGARVTVHSDDNTHYNAIVISDSFTGKSLIQRHQMVYGCLGQAVGNEIHALSLKTHTIDELKLKE
ncbi:MAG: BolA/IbaG family iron-sulfur metabolism protein [Woeseiaceae bacterium]|jgi:acid stress-induced BolA-like protein IbaG/YrbA|nr:BolA/IbaG family iron-sulfur metabolism protein [Woeseiaceae bacterium]MDG1016608.1 BolA/IbaG family iron-sulfur metabolism protein [Woeseiaceae bacterium]MDG1712967.1 BolA/IbaG family iron-sulfur metabolism protein [Woeseiaceae bacterium]MDG1865251.1 BolA/IbaG family iron-sulfur metabolism protein [Woeseiaceae bacterium]